MFVASVCSVSMSYQIHAENDCRFSFGSLRVTLVLLLHCDGINRFRYIRNIVELSVEIMFDAIRLYLQLLHKPGALCRTLINGLSPIVLARPLSCVSNLRNVPNGSSGRAGS